LDEDRNAYAWSLVRLGRTQARLADEARARQSWSKALETMDPLIAAGTRTPGYMDTIAQALLELGRVEQARPYVTRLLERGHDWPEFVAVCRRHGLLPEANGTTGR
jgi:tetratricopeptide (TPR) repeat protein